MRLFALDTSRGFGEKVGACLGVALDDHEERNFEDGEHKIRPLVSVRDKDAYVIHSLYAESGQGVNDKLCKLLFFIAALKDAGAKRVTALTPYLCYARKDRRTKARDPVTMRYVAALFEAVRVDRVVAIDVHNLQAFQNAFRCPTEHLEAQNLFADFFQKHFRPDEKLAVMSPDLGGIKRAEQFRDKLAEARAASVDFAFMEKKRSKGVVSGDSVAGAVEGRAVIIFDDMICSGTTMARAAAACFRLGASSVHAAATHGAFTDKANAVFQEKALTKLIVTNTLEQNRLDQSLSKEKLHVLDVAPLFAEVVKRLHTGGSLVSLMGLEEKD